ncbi:unnamed protein product [Cyprideis torosa]|uniref:Uncharacterized protein n=1 Tax=Cyprideis torosa TaxID=163714 RepID=A0A7R8ZPH9_9CRUS|nr:unnamed protein product [Cyprideis torosa]CAG0893982.1 unnamed protein product [Cyprideis torosa]
MPLHRCRTVEGSSGNPRDEEEGVLSTSLIKAIMQEDDDDFVPQSDGAGPLGDPNPPIPQWDGLYDSEAGGLIFQDSPRRTRSVAIDPAPIPVTSGPLPALPPGAVEYAVCDEMSGASQLTGDTWSTEEQAVVAPSSSSSDLLFLQDPLLLHSACNSSELLSQLVEFVEGRAESYSAEQNSVVLPENVIFLEDSARVMPEEKVVLYPEAGVVDIGGAIDPWEILATPDELQDKAHMVSYEDCSEEKAAQRQYGGQQVTNVSQDQCGGTNVNIVQHQHTSAIGNKIQHQFTSADVSEFQDQYASANVKNLQHQYGITNVNEQQRQYSTARVNKLQEQYGGTNVNINVQHQNGGAHAADQAENQERVADFGKQPQHQVARLSQYEGSYAGNGSAYQHVGKVKKAQHQYEGQVTNKPKHQYGSAQVHKPQPVMKEPWDILAEAIQTALCDSPQREPQKGTGERCTTVVSGQSVVGTPLYVEGGQSEGSMLVLLSTGEFLEVPQGSEVIEEDDRVIVIPKLPSVGGKKTAGRLSSATPAKPAAPNFKAASNATAKLVPVKSASNHIAKLIEAVTTPHPQPDRPRGIRPLENVELAPKPPLKRPATDGSSVTKRPAEPSMKRPKVGRNSVAALGNAAQTAAAKPPANVENVPSPVVLSIVSESNPKKSSGSDQEPIVLEVHGADEKVLKMILKNPKILQMILNDVAADKKISSIPSAGVTVGTTGSCSQKRPGKSSVRQTSTAHARKTSGFSSASSGRLATTVGTVKTTDNLLRTTTNSVPMVKTSAVMSTSTSFSAIATCPFTTTSVSVAQTSGLLSTTDLPLAANSGPLVVSSHSLPSGMLPTSSISLTSTSSLLVASRDCLTANGPLATTSLPSAPLVVRGDFLIPVSPSMAMAASDSPAGTSLLSSPSAATNGIQMKLSTSAVSAAPKPIPSGSLEVLNTTTQVRHIPGSLMTAADAKESVSHPSTKPLMPSSRSAFSRPIRMMKPRPKFFRLTKPSVQFSDEGDARKRTEQLLALKQLEELMGPSQRRPCAKKAQDSVGKGPKSEGTKAPPPAIAVGAEVVVGGDASEGSEVDIPLQSSRRPRWLVKLPEARVAHGVSLSSPPSTEHDYAAEDVIVEAKEKEAHQKEMDGSLTGEAHQKEMDGSLTDETHQKEMDGSLTDEAHQEMDGSLTGEAHQKEIDGSLTGEAHQKEMDGSLTDETDAEVARYTENPKSPPDSFVQLPEVVRPSSLPVGAGLWSRPLEAKARKQRKGRPRLRRKVKYEEAAEEWYGFEEEVEDWLGDDEDVAWIATGAWGRMCSRRK